MFEPGPGSDVESIVAHLRLRWREARDRVRSDRVELFAKTSTRTGVRRADIGTGATSDHVREWGIAVRVWGPGHQHAGFAAASGITSDAVQWAVDTASTFEARASAVAPDDSIESERWDLDPESALPHGPSLASAMASRPDVQWIEAGTTIEVLIGTGGWLAVRRRDRVWALGGETHPRLVAQRGFTGWERLLDASVADELSPHRSGSAGLGAIVLLPDAASPLVTALVARFHGPESLGSAELGSGWEVMDQPIRPDGLVGGAFDDAGFPSNPRPLAGGGNWLGRLSGPGTLRRSSFREPPTESASNIVIPSGSEGEISNEAGIARRCRVLQLSDELWVLELDLVSHTSQKQVERRWVRVAPHTLLAACTASRGAAIVTAGGPIVPGLLFDRLTSR